MKQSVKELKTKKFLISKPEDILEFRELVDHLISCAIPFDVNFAYLTNVTYIVIYWEE